MANAEVAILNYVAVQFCGPIDISHNQSLRPDCPRVHIVLPLLPAFISFASTDEELIMKWQKSTLSVLLEITLTGREAHGHMPADTLLKLNTECSVMLEQIFVHMGSSYLSFSVKPKQYQN